MELTENQIRADELRKAAELIQNLHPGETKASVVLLNERADRLDPPMPPEPEGDVVLVDGDGDAWTRDSLNGGWTRADLAASWSMLVDTYGPVRVYRAEDPS